MRRNPALEMGVLEVLLRPWTRNGPDLAEVERDIARAAPGLRIGAIKLRPPRTLDYDHEQTYQH